MNLSRGFNFLGTDPTLLVAEDPPSEPTDPPTVAHDSYHITEFGELNSALDNGFLNRAFPNSFPPYSNFGLPPSQNQLQHYPSEALEDVVANQSTCGDSQKLAQTGQRKRKPRHQNGVMSPGPNKFGRKGTIRCQRCRSWRRKVVPQLRTLS